MITIHMEHTSGRDREIYGKLYQSTETVDVPQYTRTHPMVVQIWDDETRTGGRGTHTLQTIPVVIAATPVDRAIHLGDLRYGEHVLLVFPDGGDVEYIVDPGHFAPPSLIRFMSVDEALDL